MLLHITSAEKTKPLRGAVKSEGLGVRKTAEPQSTQRKHAERKQKVKEFYCRPYGDAGYTTYYSSEVICVVSLCCCPYALASSSPWSLVKITPGGVKATH